MSVRRFDVDCNGGWEGCTTYENENEWGDYVAHDDYAALLARHNALKEVAKGLRDALRIINSGDHEDKPHSAAGYTLHLWSRELAALIGEG